MSVASYEAGTNCKEGFRREKMVQTVTWLSGLPKEFDLSIRASMSNAVSVA